MLVPLPATRFKLSDWKATTVQFNNHISVDGMLYSDPYAYEYIKKKVDVKVTDITIEIIYNHNRIASHRHLKRRPGQYSASIMDINYTSRRKLKKKLIRRLATCEYISEHRNLFITKLQAAIRLTWPVPLAWKHVSGITIPYMFGCQICTSIFK